MDDETVPASEETSYAATEPAADPVQTETTATDPVDVTVPLTAPETVPVETQEKTWIQEDFVGESVPETTENVIVEVIESVGSDICHTNLFGSFLICGTLVGIVLLRKVYGT